MTLKALVVLAQTVVAAAFFLGPAFAQRVPELHYCDAKGLGTPDVRIRNCTALIESRRQSAKDRAAAFANRAIAYSAKGDIDRAIADYTEAIRLEPNNILFYNNRGIAYHLKGDNDRAIADAADAIRLDPNSALSAVSYTNRGIAYRAKGDYDRAIVDFNEAIRLEPKFAWAYFSRGLANVYIGSLPKSVADLNEASALNPKDAYTALWLDIVSKRSNLPSRLAQVSSQLDMSKWPAPLIHLYLGEMTLEAALAAAGDPIAETKKRRVCEVNFYAGEMALQQDRKDEAVRLFRLAVADCTKGLVAFDAANAELKALSAKP